MFETYDNIEKKYAVLYYNGHVDLLTTQELYEYYIFNVHIGTGHDDFFDFKKDLDNGKTIDCDDYEFDWGLGSTVFKGRLKIYMIPKTSTQVTSKSTSTICLHENKYINMAGGVRFWVCPKCKADLGNA